MDKPITVARQEFMEKMAALINESQLPSFIIADIFELTIPTLRSYAEQQYKADLAAFDAQKESTEEE